MAIAAVCRLAILKRMLATPMTLLVAHRLWEQVKALSTNSDEEVQTIYTLSPTITHNLRVFSDARQKTNLGKSGSYVNKSIDHSYYYLTITKPSLITVANNVSLSHPSSQ